MAAARRGMVPLPTPVERQVIADGEVITYQLIRTHSRVRTVGLRLAADQTIVVRAPLDVSDAFIADFVGGRARWIRARRVAVSEIEGAAALHDGDAVPIHGRPHVLRLAFSGAKRASVGVSDGCISVALPRGGAPDAAERAVLRWLATESLRVLTQETALWSPLLGVAPTAVHVRNQRTRWGSCAADGVIRYNWRLVLLAPELLDYVVVHELAHLLEPNHSPRFWAHVARLIPGHQERRKALNAARLSLPAFAR